MKTFREYVNEISVKGTPIKANDYKLDITDPMGNKKYISVTNVNDDISISSKGSISNFEWMIKDMSKIPDPRGSAAVTAYIKNILTSAYKKAKDSKDFSEIISRDLNTSSVIVSKI